MPTSKSILGHRKVSPGEPITIIISVTLLGLMFSFAPFSHNPDANFYYGAALRVSQGRFADSVEGMWAPLLSWLMAPLIAAGVAAPMAFRVINFFVLIWLLLASARLCRVLKFSRVHTFIVVFMLTVQLAYLSAFLVTSDLLAAALAVWTYVALINGSYSGMSRGVLWIGVLGALQYYAKALQLPIFLISTPLVKVCRARLEHKPLDRALLEAALSCLTAFLLCLPWMILISQKYEHPIFSAQQLAANGTLNTRQYSPFAQAEYYLTGVSPQAAEGAKSQSVRTLSWLKSFWPRMSYSISSVSSQSRELLFGEEAWWCYLFLVTYSIFRTIQRPSAYPGLFQLSVVAGVHFACYVIIWGPYIRYYFPIMPVTNIAFVIGAGSLKNTLLLNAKNRKVLTAKRFATLLNALFSLLIFSMIYTTTMSVINDWNTRDDEVVDFALNLPQLRDKQGVITGNINSPYHGYISYMLGRECWNSIYTKDKETPDALSTKLKQWKIEQILWFGERYENLDRTPGITLAGEFEKNGINFIIYDFSLPLKH